MKIRLVISGLLLSAWLLISSCASTGQGNSYTIEAGFFGDYEQALTRASAVKKVLGNATLSTDIIHYQVVYYVYSGTYINAADAQKSIAKLKKSWYRVGSGGKTVVLFVFS